jgi:hypothetical protein
MGKRDIQADRVMIEKHLGWAETGSWARYFADIASHYLTRTEEAESALSHERRKVDAAITELVETLCPHTRKFNTHECDWWRIKPTSVASCHKCINDYLNQRAKEAEKHGA